MWQVVRPTWVLSIRLAASWRLGWLRFTHRGRQIAYLECGPCAACVIRPG